MKRTKTPIKRPRELAPSDLRSVFGALLEPEPRQSTTVALKPGSKLDGNMPSDTDL